MRQHFLALVLLGMLMIGADSDGAAGERKAAAKCRKPNGKLGQTKANGCGSNVCKKSGGGGAAWESCPLPASAEEVQEEIKSLRTFFIENENETKKIQELLDENEKETKKIQELLDENQKETKKNLELLNENQQKNHELLMEVLKRLGPVSGEIPISMVPATTSTTTTTKTTTTTTTTTTKTTTTTTTTTKSSSGLNVVFELEEEFQITKGFLMGTLPYLGKKYKIKFEWFITGFGRSYQNIIHFTTGGDGGWGKRTPGIWLHNNNQITLHSAIQPTSYKWVAFAGKTGIWITMEFSQYMVADNKFEFDFKIDGTSYWTVPNSRPEAFKGIQMYAGDPWHTALNGKIRNFQVQTRND